MRTEQPDNPPSIRDRAEDVAADEKADRRSDADGYPAGVARARRPQQRGRWVLVAAAVTAVVAGGLVLVQRTNGSADAPAAPSVPATVPVTVGSMVDQTNVRGTLHYPDGPPVESGLSGVVTTLPTVGTTISPGGMLYTVDTRPVVLMAGQLPAYRAFQAGMTPGADVAQLEQNLVAMGYLHVVPDNRFTAATGTAIRAWQRAQGVPRTGSVDRSVVLFAPGAVRVATWSSRVGAQVTAGAELFTTSGTDKVVDVDLNLNDQQLAVVGARLTVTLPDGTHVPATVTAVGEAVERAGAAGATGTVVRPVQAALGDQTPAAPFSQADVTVSFTSTLAQDVLTVPVEALVAIDATTFGVEVLDADGGTTTVPVTVGVFASGRVQVTGEGIVAGLDVVVPQA